MYFLATQSRFSRKYSVILFDCNYFVPKILQNTKIHENSFRNSRVVVHLQPEEREKFSRLSVCPSVIQCQYLKPFKLIFRSA
jgi:hypothetical protein